MGLTFRIFSTTVSDCVRALASVHETVALMSPLNAAGPEVTLNVALKLAPGATSALLGSPPAATAIHPAGNVIFRLTFFTAPLDVLTNATIETCEEPGENVCRPGGFSLAAA